VANSSIYRDIAVQTLLVLTAVGCSVANAASVEIQIIGEDGQPVSDVAVFIEQAGVAAAAESGSATMDQRDTQFVPHILVVRSGTSVEFPNSDVVAHHVYSFSKPNNFVLPLYKGDVHDPVTFEYDGVVTVGCNIHDHMLGYIVVVDTDVYGTTDASGRVTLTVDEEATGYSVNIWSPRIRDEASSLSRDLQVASNEDAQLTFRLEKKLRAPHHSQTDGVKWSEY
jgi:plastocyanin